MADLVYRGTREQLRLRLRQLPGVLSGRVPDPTGAAESIRQAVGIEALSILKEAYVAKARGGTDEAGIRWAPLDPKTIAYGRRHPGLKRGRGPRPLLTKQQDELWRGVFAGTYRRLAAAGDENAGGNAAALAWVLVKARGGKTILGEYGSRPAEILRDTGRLLNSLSPAHPDNVLRQQPGEVSVGTNVVYAERHHRGDPGRNLPARPLWPDDGDRWPATWTQRLLDVVADGVRDLTRRLAGG